jgi:hypothetical protein
LSPRFVVLFVPSLLLAFEPRRTLPATSSERGRRALVGALSTAWVAVFVLRLPAYNRETLGIHALVAEMQPALSVRPIVFERESKAFPGVPALLHLPAYYQVEKGGVQGYSFAMYPISVVRYRAGVPSRMVGGAEWSPETFDWQRELASYDYFVVHSATDRSRELFGNAPHVALESRRGDWWAYRKRTSELVSSRTE